MKKKVSKSELQRVIKDTEVLEIIIQRIQREASESAKNNDLLEFIRKAKEQIKDQRDILLISVKIK